MKLRRKAALVVILCMATLVADSYIFKIDPINAQTGGLQIDAFTNKTPFDGRGRNQTSDAFSPYETIVLNALVTYNGDPVAGFLVTFQIQAPTFTLIRTTTTDQNGLASIQFNLPIDNVEQTAFGTWFVLASTAIGSLYASDTLTFKVGYIVTANITTVDPVQYPQPLIEKLNFTKGDDVGLQITLTNIAMTSKNVTMMFAVTDALNQIIYVSTAASLTMPPGNLTYPLLTFLIPASATTGTATITLSIYNPFLGKITPYAPAKTAHFKIVLIDVAVTNANLSSTQVYPGQIVDISITVKNLGEFTETFNVTIFYNETAITTFNVMTLEPNEERTLNYSWNTSSISLGIYTITAIANQVQDESNTVNNHFTAGQVSIMQRSSSPFNPRDLYLILGIIGFLFFIVLLALLALRRRKKDESGTLELINYFS